MRDAMQQMMSITDGSRLRLNSLKSIWRLCHCWFAAARN
jgi:hypothetical protein